MDSSELQARLASSARVSHIARTTMFLPEAARGNDNTLHITIGSAIRTLSHRYTLAPAQPIELFAQQIHDTWYLFILAAQHTDADHPAQDRLTRLLLWARELGVLEREGEGAQEAAVTKEGRIWMDLPGLLGDVQEAWRSGGLAAAQRCNLAAALARLAGLGVLDDAFSGCGLAVMSVVCETGPLEGDGSAWAGVQLLPVVQVWLRYAGDKLLRLSMANHPGNDAAWYVGDGGACGGLAREKGIDTARYSRERFLFWKTRLYDLWAGSGDEGVKEVAAACSVNIDVIWNSYFGLENDWFKD